MKRLSLPILLLASVALAPAQSLKEYLRLRQMNGVSQVAGVNALQTVTGSKALEIQGVVKGSFRVGNQTSLLVERPNGETQAVDASVVPEWLIGNDTPARLLIRAIRPDSSTALRAVLIGAAREDEMRKVDAEAQAKQKKVLAAKAKAKTTPAPRNSRTTLYGPIGRGGSRSRSPRAWVLPTSQVTSLYAAFIKKVNPRLNNGEVVNMAKAIVGFSLHYDVDPRLVIAMIMVESGFDPSSVSHSGAMGLGQLMPGTARWMGVNNPFDSIDNLYGMIKLINTHMTSYRKQTGKEFEALVLTLAAYNAGEGAVRRAGGVPPYRETQAYVRKVLALYYRFAGYD